MVGTVAATIFSELGSQRLSKVFLAIPLKIPSTSLPTWISGSPLMHHSRWGAKRSQKASQVNQMATATSAELPVSDGCSAPPPILLCVFPFKSLLFSAVTFPPLSSLFNPISSCLKADHLNSYFTTEVKGIRLDILWDYSHINSLISSLWFQKKRFTSS